METAERPTGKRQQTTADEISSRPVSASHGRDLTFSANKSVSLLWAFDDDDTRRHVLEAFEEATAEAMAYMESVASSTRGASRTQVLDDHGNPIL